MILYEVAKELWEVKANKNLRKHSNQKAMYREIRNTLKRYKDPKKIIKTMSKLYGLPTAFFERIQNYERVEEFEQGNEEK